MMKRRVFISVPMDQHLDRVWHELVQGILELISNAGPAGTKVA
jgi:hypothetical protein